jgi:hypothetical protein
MSIWETLAGAMSPIPIQGVTKESPLTEVINPAGAMNRRMMAQMLMPDYNKQQEQGKYGGFNQQMGMLQMPLLKGMGQR